MQSAEIEHQRGQASTSIAAHEKLLKTVKATRGEVLRMIADYSEKPGWQGLTDREIDDLCEKAYGVRGRETYRKRRGELSKVGIVEAASFCRTPKTSRREREQQVWRIASSKSMEEIAARAHGDLGSYITAIIAGTQARSRKKIERHGSLPDETKSKLIRAQNALIKIKRELRDYRVTSLEDRIWRMACEGLGIDPEDELSDAKRGQSSGPRR